MKMADLIKAAKEYDLEHRPFGQNWTSVPDSQVARLLAGAALANRGRLPEFIDVPAPEQRQAPLIPRDG
jgi:hypothetical protein